MFDLFVFEPAQWLGKSVALAALGSFAWGLGSALLSPCHLGIIPLLGSHAAGYGPFDQEEQGRVGAEQGSAASPWRGSAQALLFTAGCFATIPLLGLLFTLLGHGLELGGHWWTVPVGALLVWFGVDMFRNHSCAHASHIWSTLRRRLGISAASGLFVLGFGYGLLASGCTIGFLVPLLVVTLPQGVLLCTFFSACFGLGHCLPMAAVGCSAPLARRLLGKHGHSHSQSEADSHPHDPQHQHDPQHRHDPHAQHGHSHAGGQAALANACLDEPHHGEALFRRIMGGLIVLIGVGFVLHPFLE